MSDELDDWMGVPDAAKLKQVAESSVRLAILTNRLTGRKVGRNYLVKRSEVQKWKPVRGRGGRPKAGAELTPSEG
jgi:excisionase family DNA binding protein